MNQFLLYSSKCYFLLFLTIPHLIVARNIPCSYHQGGWGGFGSPYYGLAQTPFEITSPNDTFVDSATGQHTNERTDDSVITFSTVGINVYYFPRGLEQIFKNLQGVEIRSCHLKEIHQADLRWYPNLLELHITDNDIETIEPGLFDYNPNLRLVGFVKNKISKIGVNVFDHLPKLLTLALNTNLCIDNGIYNNRAKVQDFIREVRTQCPNPITPVDNCLDTCSRCRSDVSALIHEVDILKTSNAELHERIENLEGKSQCSVKEIAKKLRALVEELEGCEA